MFLDAVFTTGVTSTFLIDSTKIQRTLFKNSPGGWLCLHTGRVEPFQWERIKLLFCLEKTGLERLFHPNKTEVSFGNTDDRKRVEGFFVTGQCEKQITSMPWLPPVKVCDSRCTADEN